MIIYKSTNKINGKCYIGQTVKTLNHRKIGHLGSTSPSNFSNALRKYGSDAFKWEIIEECSSKEEMDEMEFHYIKQYNSFKPNGYNLTWGGDKETLGWIPSEETRKNISKGLKKFWENQPEEYKKIWGKRISKQNSGEKNYWYGKKRLDITGESNPAKRPESRKKISDAIKGCKRPDLSKRNKNNAGKTYEEIYGKEKAEKTKQKMSKSHKGIKHKPMSDKAKENLSISSRKYIYELTSPEGKTLIIDNMCKFSKESGLNKASLLYLVHGKNKKGIHKGWKGKIIGMI